MVRERPSLAEAMVDWRVDMTEASGGFHCIAALYLPACNVMSTLCFECRQLRWEFITSADADVHVDISTDADTTKNIALFDICCQ